MLYSVWAFLCLDTGPFGRRGLRSPIPKPAPKMSGSDDSPIRVILLQDACYLWVNFPAHSILQARRFGIAYLITSHSASSHLRPKKLQLTYNSKLPCPTWQHVLTLYGMQSALAWVSSSNRSKPYRQRYKTAPRLSEHLSPNRMSRLLRW